MRPFLKISLSKSIKSGTGKVVLFGPNPSSAPLNERLISFSFEESTGDDLYTTRKGRKDVVSFTYLDNTTENPDFLTGDGRFIELQDLVFIEYGWILDSGELVGPLPVSDSDPSTVREFRVIRLEPRYTDKGATVTVVCYDRSVDLDMFPLSMMIKTLVGADENSLGAKQQRQTPQKANTVDPFIGPPQLPPPPNFQVTSKTSTTVTLGWTDVEGENAYTAFRDDISEFILEPGTTTITFSKLTPATRYKFDIRAANNDGVGPKATVSTATLFAEDGDKDPDAKTPAKKAKETLGNEVGLLAVLKALADGVGLVLDPTGKKSFLDRPENKTSMHGRGAIARETPHSYLRYLAEQAGYMFYVQNRSLFFGVRTLPDKKKPPQLTLIRGRGETFDPKSVSDFSTGPLLDLDIEHKFVTEIVKVSLNTQNKRTGEISAKSEVLRELTNVVDLVSAFIERPGIREIPEGEDDLNPLMSIPEQEVGEATRFQQQQNINKTEVINFVISKFFDTARLVDEQAITSALSRFLTPTLLQTPTKMADPAARANFLAELNALSQRLMEQFAIRGLIAKVKTFGNPRIRHNQLVKFGGEVPPIYTKGLWYVHSVRHEMSGKNYFTTLSLLAADASNPFMRHLYEEAKKRWAQDHSGAKPEDNKRMERSLITDNQDRVQNRKTASKKVQRESEKSFRGGGG